MKPPLRAPAALGLAALYLALQASTLAHGILVPHVACVDHGGFDHVPATGGRPSATARRGPAAVPPRVVAHVHCCAAGHGFVPAPDVVLRGAARPLPAARLVRPPSPRPRPSGRVALLRLAPKTSPPA